MEKIRDDSNRKMRIKAKFKSTGVDVLVVSVCSCMQLVVPGNKFQCGWCAHVVSKRILWVETKILIEVLRLENNTK